MRVDAVEIANFRNISHAVFSPGANINFFTGDNAQGKTNTIEAVRMCLCGVSHREKTAANFISFNKNLSITKVRLTDDTEVEFTNELKLNLAPPYKSIYVNGKRAVSRSELFKSFPTVFCGPDDMELIRGGPGARRDYLNESIGNISAGYASLITAYNKVLKQRNTLLKSFTKTDENLLDVYDKQLSEFCASIVAYRIKFLRQIRPKVITAHAYICGEKDILELAYVTDAFSEGFTPNIIAAYKKAFFDGRARDIAAKTTLSGIHRDDIDVRINSKSAKVFSSMGQQRTTALCLKLALIELYREKTGNLPVVFLDDVTGELDYKRRNRVLKLVGNTQSFIACTKDSLPAEAGSHTIFEVKAGKVSPAL